MQGQQNVFKYKKNKKERKRKSGERKALGLTSSFESAANTKWRASGSATTSKANKLRLACTGATVDRSDSVIVP
jgi:hypothetical protein